MKTTNRTITLLVFTIIQLQTLQAQHDLEVVVKNIKETSGTLRVSLFTNDADFLKKAVDQKISKVTSTEATFVFANLKSGEYAVSIIHDKNENEKLDANFMGIPKEPYGFSNNAMGNFGPPTFDKAKLLVDGNKSSSISLRE